MLTYNLALVAFFLTWFELVQIQAKTLHSLAFYSDRALYNKVLLAVFFSMAGVPPFTGFFTKLFIFLSLIHRPFVIFFFIFFTLLFLGLYFYMQNVRFLVSSKALKATPPHAHVLLVSSCYAYIALPVVFFLV